MATLAKLYERLRFTETVLTNYFEWIHRENFMKANNTAIFVIVPIQPLRQFHLNPFELSQFSRQFISFTISTNHRYFYH